MNVLWIANPTGIPEEQDLTIIKNWLHATPENLAGTEISKKIVITFGTNIEIASNVISICESLGLNTKPRRSENPNDFNGFFLKSAHGIDGSIYQHQNVDLEDVSIVGCVEGGPGHDASDGSKSTKVDKGLYVPQPLPGIPDKANLVSSTFFSIQLEANTTKLLYFTGTSESNDDTIKEIVYTTAPDSWYVPGDSASATFNVHRGSGYRLFINTVSESPNELVNLQYNIENVALPNGQTWSLVEKDDDDDDDIYR